MNKKHALFNFPKQNQQQFYKLELSKDIQGERCRDPTSQEFEEDKLNQ